VYFKGCNTARSPEQTFHETDAEIGEQQFTLNFGISQIIRITEFGNYEKLSQRNLE
jgi:hypothetical protein